MNDVALRFSDDLELLQRHAFIDYGLVAQPQRTTGELEFQGQNNRDRIVLTWSTSRDGNVIRWSLHRPRAGGKQNESLSEGVFPQKSVFIPGMGALATITETPPVRTIAPTGKLAATVFGGTMALVVLSLMRLIGVSIPPQAWQDADLFPPLPEIVSTVQQVAGSLSFGDLPMILAGSVFGSPALGLGVLAVVSFLFTIHTLPQIGIGDDLVTGRAIAMYSVAVVCAMGCIAMSPFPWNLVVTAGAAYLVYAVLLVFTIPWQLSRWLRFARRLQLLRWSNATSIVADEHEGHRVTLGDGAEELERRAGKLRKRVWKKRDKAFTKPFQRAYFEARTLRIALGIESRAARRGQKPSISVIHFINRADDLLFGLRTSVLRALPFATVIGVFVLALSPTPWIPPTCITQGDTSTTAFLLPNGPAPAYLDDVTRTVELLPSWAAVDVAAGACSTP